MIVMEGEGIRENVKLDRNISTEIDHVKPKLSGSQSLLTQELLVDGLQTSISNAAHYVLAQGLEVLGTVVVGKSSRSHKFKKEKEKPERFLKEVNTCRMEKEELEKKKLRKEAALSGITWSVVNFERAVTCLRT